mgnify:CR=1 FL=1
MQLDMLPDDLAGRVRELQNYDFTSAEAAGAALRGNGFRRLAHGACRREIESAFP